MGKRLTSTPISAKITRAVPTSIPSIKVRSTPKALNSGPVASKRTSLLLRPRLRGLTVCVFSPARLGKLASSALTFSSHSAIWRMAELVQIVSLAKGEEMFGPPRPLQRKGDLVLAVTTSRIAQLGQFDGVAFARQDGGDDQHSGHPGDVADDLRQLDVHLLQGLLHVLDVAGGVAHQHLPLPPVGTQGQHRIRRPKRRTQETVGMQALNPLRVQHVGLGRAPQRESCPGSTRLTSKPSDSRSSNRGIQ